MQNIVDHDVGSPTHHTITLAIMVDASQGVILGTYQGGAVLAICSILFCVWSY
jgi:hypothetical protein